LSNQLKSISNRNDFKLNYLLGYFKGLNIEPSVYEVSAYFKRSELKNDLESYVNVGMLNRKIQKGIGETGGVDENTKLADDIYDMQARTYSSTTATYNLFNN